MMKKLMILFIFTILTTAGCQRAPEQFVNPLFYKTMDPISTVSWRTKITPTSMVSDNKKGTFLHQKCTLIENTMNSVTLECEGPYVPENIEHNTFVLLPDETRVYGGILVELIEKRPDEITFSSSTFVIRDGD